ncbi:nucleotide-diphospho-sugar transferase, partial [Colletotrichum cereale]
LPHIPPKIWQIFISSDNKDSSIPTNIPIYVPKWLSLHPSFAYTIIDNSGALAIVSPKMLHSIDMPLELTPLYDQISRPVMRADFMRYAILALEGGVYSDSDTYPLFPLRDWVPQGLRNNVRLIVGIEADSQPPIPGTTYPVQFGQWTIAGAKGHPIFWRMLRRVLVEVENRTKGDNFRAIDGKQKILSFTNNDILRISGPAGWTEELFEYMSIVTATEVTWRNLTGLTDPVLLGDVLVLPIDGFTTGVGHSGASLENGNATMVRHQFSGSWK